MVREDPLGLHVVLEAGALRLEPLEERHRAELRRACVKNGATLEGILRNHMITWTGYERDSAIFSVVERDREKLGLC